MSLCHFPSITWSTHKLFSFPTFSTFLIASAQQLKWEAQRKAPCRGLVLACSSKKPRVSKKSRLSRANMSDSELCHELRNFISAEGLPEDHIPSMAELSKHGRKDLANIVRRKGYKVIAELLKNEIGDGIHPEGNLSENQDSSNCSLSRFPEASSGGLSLMESYVNNKNGACVEIGESSGSSVISKIEKVQFAQNKELDPDEDISAVHKLHESELDYDDSDVNFPETDKGSVSSDIVQESASSSPEDYTFSEDVSLDTWLSKTDFGMGISSQGGEADKITETDNLRGMLQQKEMELLQLRQEIEKEKLALSALQNKATAEISYVESLISAKDAELKAAEEGLIGLKEVRIEYHGHGEVVEVSGSFNGWHHRIKLDRLNSTETREPVFWTTLWLYPGVYEIKFIVDGHWRTCPRWESVTKGHITNNIVRVER